MAKADNHWQRETAAAAARIDAARDAGQLSLFEGDAGGDAAGKRGKGKALSSLRDLLAARGYRMPEDVLANIAGLDDPDGPAMAALKKAETVALAIYGHAQAPATVRMRLFETFYAESRRALDALLPYGLAKITPDVTVQAVQIVQMPAPSAPQNATHPADQARDITPSSRRFGPPPMPEQIEQNQSLGKSPLPTSDALDRTE